MYRLVNDFLHPYTLLSLLAIGAYMFSWRKRADARRRLLSVTVPCAALLLISIPVVAHVAVGTLEWRFTPRTKLAEENQAMVVLGGYAMPADVRRPHEMLGADTLYRCLHAAELYHESGPCLTVVSGGQVEVEKNQPAVAPLMKTFLTELGVEPDDLLVEDRSTTTYENAQECQRILAERGITRITLVTNASHMLRASRCFRAAGFDVIPAPCDFKTGKFEVCMASFLPSAHAAARTGDVAHEWLGIVWYWLHGRI